MRRSGLVGILTLRGELTSGLLQCGCESKHNEHHSSEAPAEAAKTKRTTSVMRGETALNPARIHTLAPGFMSDILACTDLAAAGQEPGK